MWCIGVCTAFIYVLSMFINRQSEVKQSDVGSLTAVDLSSASALKMKVANENKVRIQHAKCPLGVSLPTYFLSQPLITE